MVQQLEVTFNYYFKFDFYNYLSKIILQLTVSREIGIFIRDKCKGQIEMNRVIIFLTPN